jgi:hypothetical protein
MVFDPPNSNWNLKNKDLAESTASEVVVKGPHAIPTGSRFGFLVPAVRFAVFGLFISGFVSS